MPTETQKVFGRRTMAPHAPSRGRENVRAPAPRPPPVTDAPSDRAASMPRSAASAQLESELREWKQARRRAYKLPWRQLVLMASICFGVGALVLPDTVNKNLEWLLYGMMAVSFYVGIRRRKA